MEATRHKPSCTVSVFPDNTVKEARPSMQADPSGHWIHISDYDIAREKYRDVKEACKFYKTCFLYSMVGASILFVALLLETISNRGGL